MTERVGLLAPQLEKSKVWRDFAAAVDRVFTDLGIDGARDLLASLRAPLNLKDVVGAEPGGALTALDVIPRAERQTLVRNAELLGFRFYDSAILDAEDYVRLCMFLGQYYDEDKGTARFADFMGFMANVKLQVVPTWTQDYVTFLKEGDPGIGVPVYRGGPWYPTTHVVLSFGLGKFAGVDRNSLIEFFYYFANINLVLWAIEMTDDASMSVNISGAGTLDIWL